MFRLWRQCRAMLIGILCVLVAGCTVSGVNNVKPTATPERYSLAGGGKCVQLGNRSVGPFTNTQASSDTFLAHSEPMIAVNPHNPLNFVAGSKFFTNLGRYLFQIGTYTSFDGGCTWTDNGVFTGFSTTSRTSDISFAFGDHNDVYAALLFQDGMKSGIAVIPSLDGGRTFGTPNIVYQDITGKIFSDKPWIAVDTTNGQHQGTISVVWSYDSDTNQELGYSRSTDGGKTFSPVALVEGSNAACTYPTAGHAATAITCDGVLGATPTVLPNGTLAVAFAYVDVSANSDGDMQHAVSSQIASRVQMNNPYPSKLLVVTSPDEGITWNSPVLVATIADIPSPFPGQKYRNFSLPAFTSDPKSGQLYLSWADYAAGNADILLSTSSNGGKRWSVPVRVNDDAATSLSQQFQPQLAIAPNGTLSVMYFDTRNDPTQHRIDVMLAQSLDHGVTFLPHVQVTTSGFDPSIQPPIDASGQQFIGDYQGLAATDQFVYPCWNDTRTGRQEIFVAAVPSALPTK